MTKQPSLHAIRHRLVQLGRARRARRWFCGLSVLLTVLLWTLAALLLIDVLFQLDVAQRVTVILLATATWCWAFYRFVRPYFIQRETEVDLALLVERQHGIDSDLVAAIEFTRPEADSWGSSTLREKVIENVADHGHQLQMAHLTDRHEPLQKLRTLAITVTLATAWLGIFPQHLPVFLRRLALGADHYPSRTVIESITVNGKLVLQPIDRLSPISIKCPEQQTIEFLVRCTRRPPSNGKLLISALDGSGQRSVELTRRDRQPASDEFDVAVFVAQLPTLLDSLRYQVYLGDAWTNPGTIEMVPLPQIDIRATVLPPEYTGASQNRPPIEGEYRLTALEGSQVGLTVRCTNSKPLHAVSIDLQTAGQDSRCDLEPTNAAGMEWQLNSRAFPPLQNIRNTIRFTLHATDQDGLQPRKLPSGEIRVQPDSPPAAVAATIHRVVLPAAQPPVAFQVHDDYGIGRLRLQLQIERPILTSDRAEAEDLPAKAPPPEVHWLEIDNVTFPITGTHLPYKHRYVVDLQPWQLHKGDRIKITLEATDYRGSTAAASVMSKPLYLEISDEAGVLATILEADQRTEKDLDQLIERQLGLGE